MLLPSLTITMETILLEDVLLGSFSMEDVLLGSLSVAPHGEPLEAPTNDKTCLFVCLLELLLGSLSKVPHVTLTGSY